MMTAAIVHSGQKGTGEDPDKDAAFSRPAVQSHDCTSRRLLGMLCRLHRDLQTGRSGSHPSLQVSHRIRSLCCDSSFVWRHGFGRRRSTPFVCTRHHYQHITESTYSQKQTHPSSLFFPRDRHVFHKACVDPWLLDQRSCPMCKLDILKFFGLTVRFLLPPLITDARSVSYGTRKTAILLTCVTF